MVNGMTSTAQVATPSRGWHQQDIQAAIRKRGTTLAELSRQAGLSPGTLQTVFSKRYPRGQRLVAQFIGVPVQTLWPHWYGPKGELLPLGGAPVRGRGAK